MKSARRLVLFAMLMATGLAAGARAQSLGRLLDHATVAPAQSPNYGTTFTSILTIPSTSFQLLGGTEAPPSQDTSARSCAAGTCVYLAGFSLPAGALMTSAELEACDGDAASQLGFVVVNFPSPVQNGAFVSTIAATGIAETPGCALLSVPFAAIVDNLQGHYGVDVNVSPGTNVGFTAVRVRYQLEVSPAPAVATFGDVPTTHPFFQYIEALAAAGITGGCGGGNFCPDSNVTRGQMAVFLAKALGLSFAN